jgi:4-carboxymuconolactone decarboxylase
MSLTPREERLVRLSAAIALGRGDVLAELRRTVPEGEPDRGWREAVLQAHLFAGVPRVVEACGVLAAHGGLGTPDADELEEPRDPAAGRGLFDAIYGAHSHEVRGTLGAYHPLLERWIGEHAYGRVIARPGLAPDRRELCAIAALAALGCERQLAAHARGAVRLGASSEEVLEAIALVAGWIDAPRHERALEIARHYGR